MNSFLLLAPIHGYITLDHMSSKLIRLASFPGLPLQHFKTSRKRIALECVQTSLKSLPAPPIAPGRPTLAAYTAFTLCIFPFTPLPTVMGSLSQDPLRHRVLSTQSRHS